jgi:hypothetical protein
MTKALTKDNLFLSITHMIMLYSNIITIYLMSHDEIIELIKKANNIKKRKNDITI